MNVAKKVEPPQVVEARLGLSLLVSCKKGRWGNLDHAGQYRTQLSHAAHPFLLDIPQRTGSNVYHSAEVYVFCTGATDISVETMIAHINWALGSYTVDVKNIVRLRILNVQCSKQDPKKHFVFFEAWTSCGVFINGSCTDFSGGGKAGTRQMTSVFKLLSTIYEVEIEEVEISYDSVLIKVSREDMRELHIR